VPRREPETDMEAGRLFQAMYNCSREEAKFGLVKRWLVEVKLGRVL